MKRQIVFDTETTGLRPEDGHRIVEIGAVELIDGVKTGRTFHTLINPEMHIPEEVVRIHHIDDEKVKNAPLFKDIIDELIDFVKDSELLIHNADFDIKMMNSELGKINRGKIWDYVKNAVCTMKLSKRLFEEERSHSLDNICKRLGFSLEEREAKGHGALLDCQLLADVYIKFNELHSTEDIEAAMEQTNWVRPPVKRYVGLELKEIVLTEREEGLHSLFLNKLAEKEKLVPNFLKTKTPALRPSM